MMSHEVFSLGFLWETCFLKECFGMSRFKKLVPLPTLLLGGLLFFGATDSASASWVLGLTVLDVNSAGTVVNAFNVVGPTTESTAPSSVGFSGTVGAFSLVVTSTLSNSNLGGATKGTLDTQVQVTLGTATTDQLFVVASATSYIAPSSPGTLTSHLGFTTPDTTATAFFASWYDNVNNLYGVTNSFPSLTGGPASFPTISAGATDSASVGPTNASTGTATAMLPVGSTQPYSITNLTELAHLTNGETYSTDSLTTVGPVPVPAGMLMALSGLSVIGLGRVLRRKMA
jgi:hypothetical protein